MDYKFGWRCMVAVFIIEEFMVCFLVRELIELFGIIATAALLFATIAGARFSMYMLEK